MSLDDVTRYGARGKREEALVAYACVVARVRWPKARVGSPEFYGRVWLVLEAHELALAEVDRVASLGRRRRRKV